MQWLPSPVGLDARRVRRLPVAKSRYRSGKWAGAKRRDKAFSKWGSKVAQSVTLNEIFCTTLLKWNVLKAKFLCPSRLVGAVLDAGMLYTSWLSLCRPLAQCQVGVLF
jgi:hypothetical protein